MSSNRGSTRTIKANAAINSRNSKNSRNTNVGASLRGITESNKIPFEGNIDLSKKLKFKFGKRKRMSTAGNQPRKSLSSSYKTVKKQRRRSSTNSTYSTNSLVGGKILGEGGVSIILSDPRLPSVGESEKFKFTDFHMNTLAKQVSRLRKPVDSIKDNKEAIYPFELLKSIEVLASNGSGLQNIEFMVQHFGLPSYFKEYVVSNRELLELISVEYLTSAEGRKYYPEDYFVKGGVDMYNPIIKNREYKYHMIFDKALGDLENNKLNIGSIGTLLNYYKELGESIIPGIEFLHLHGLVHLDIKVGNIFVYRILDKENKPKIQFKLADFDLLTRVIDRVKNPESYPTSEMRSDDYAYYPSVIDAYVFRKKLLKLAYITYDRKRQRLESQQKAQLASNISELVSHVEGARKSVSKKEPLFAANNSESGFINTNTKDIEEQIKPESPNTFNLSSFKFYIKYMKTLGKTLQKHDFIIQYHSNLAIKIKSLCMEHNLDLHGGIFTLLREIAEIKHGILEKEKEGEQDQFITGIINIESYYDTMSENVTKIYNYFAPKGKLDELGFYSFIGEFTDVYAFCLVLLDLLNNYVDYLIYINEVFTSDVEITFIKKILQFIKTHQLIDTYLEPGNDVSLKKVKPVSILKSGFSSLISMLESLTNLVTRT